MNNMWVGSYSVIRGYKRPYMWPCCKRGCV